MKKLFLFFICFCSLGCFAQAKEEKDLFPYKFIEEKLIESEDGLPPIPKYHTIFFVELEDKQIGYILDISTLQSIYYYEYELKGNHKFTSSNSFLYEVLNFKKTIKSKDIKKHLRGGFFTLSSDIKKDYENLSLDEFRSKYTEKKSEHIYVTQEYINKFDEILSICYFLYLNEAYVKINSIPSICTIYFYDEKR